MAWRRPLMGGGWTASPRGANALRTAGVGGQFGNLFEARAQAVDEGLVYSTVDRGQRVEDPKALLSHRDQPGPAKVAKVPGNGRLVDPKGSDDVADAQLTGRQEVQDPQPGAVGKSAKHEGHALGASGRHGWASIRQAFADCLGKAKAFQDGQLLGYQAPRLRAGRGTGSRCSYRLCPAIATSASTLATVIAPFMLALLFNWGCGAFLRARLV